MIDLITKLVSAIDKAADAYDRHVRFITSQSPAQAPCEDQKPNPVSGEYDTPASETPEPARKRRSRKSVEPTPAPQPENTDTGDAEESTVSHDTPPAESPKEEGVEVSLELVRALAIELFSIGRELGPEKEAASRADWNKLREGAGVASLAEATPSQLKNLHDGLESLLAKWKGE